MKAKTMLGLIACASACVSLSAFGNTTNDWFDVTVTDAIVPHGCETNGAAVTVEGGKINLEDASLGINKFDTAPTSDGIVKISATALLTPSSTNDFDVSDSPKAGFAVGVDGQNETNFYGYASNSWHKLTGATPGAGDTSFSMILNYRDKVVSFYVDDVLLTSEDPLILDANSLAAINASGSGSITSVTGAYEVAVCAIENGNKYGSVADALNAGGTSGGSATIQYINDNGKPVASEAANGLDAATCIALGVDATDEDAVVRFVPADSDTDANNVTLKVGSDNIDTGLYVTYTISGSSSGTQTTNDGTVKIPTATGVYTITPTSVSTTAN